MMNRHAREAVTSRLRLRDHDYTEPGTYFVTVCTVGRECRFGEVRDARMVSSVAGDVIQSWWESMPRQFPGVSLDAMVVMPNHLHGIIMIDEVLPDANLSAMIKWFKGMTTHDHMIGVRYHGWPRFNGRLWQSGFYDHIVRSEVALDRIRASIDANPSRWQWDEENPERADCLRPRAQGLIFTHISGRARNDDLLARGWLPGCTGKRAYWRGNRPRGPRCG